jgi:hypothetical protein
MNTPATDQELWLPSPHHSSRKDTAPRLIVVHASEGIVDVRQLGRWFADPASSVSTHAGADPAGRLGRYVSSGLAAWSVARYNRAALSIMLCTVPGATVRYSPIDWYSLRLMLDTAGRWIGREALAAGIPLVKLDAAAARGGAAGVCGGAAGVCGGAAGVCGGAAGVCGYENLIDRVTGVGPGFPWRYLLDQASEASDA